MALSELDMMNLWAKQLTGYKSQWERLFDFGYAIEAEVRKHDDALIRQMMEALKQFQYRACESIHPDFVDEAITAARARIAPTPPTA